MAALAPLFFRTRRNFLTSNSTFNTTNNSSSINGTGSLNASYPEQFCFDADQDDDVVLKAIIIILFVICVVGNTLVVCVLNQKNRRQRLVKTYTNFLLSALAITDMSVYLFNILLHYAFPKRDQSFALCKVFALQFIGKTASMCIVASVSLERYYSVVHPTEFIMTWNKARLMVVFSWYYAIMSSIFDFFSYRPILYPICNEPPTMICDFVYNYGTDLTIVVATSSFAHLVVPIVVVVYTNISITIALLGKPSGLPWRKSRKKDGLQRAMSITSIDLSQRRYIVKVILLLTTSVIVCSTPYALASVLIPTIGITVDLQTMNAFFYLSMVTSVINPFVFSFFSREFRQICTKMLCQWWDGIIECCS